MASHLNIIFPVLISINSLNFLNIKLIRFIVIKMTHFHNWVIMSNNSWICHFFCLQSEFAVIQWFQSIIFRWKGSLDMVPHSWNFAIFSNSTLSSFSVMKSSRKGWNLMSLKIYCLEEGLNVYDLRFNSPKICLQNKMTFGK